MRIVIDLQAVQSTNARRGIGRYAMSLVKAMVRLRGDHEVFIALNGLFPRSVDKVRLELEGLLPAQNIRAWSAPGPIDALDPADDARLQAAAVLRETFLASLRPDWVLVSSLFEDGPNTVTAVGSDLHRLPTAVVLYDLIPLRYPHLYLQDEVRRAWYDNKLAQLRQADLLLAISEASGTDAVQLLGVPPQTVINIRAAAHGHFQPMHVNDQERGDLTARHGLTRPFLMYTGGIDPRKNVEGLIRAWARQPQTVRDNHQLAVVCEVDPAQEKRLRQLARDAGLDDDELVLTGYVPDSDLVALYNLCKAFVFPSWYEGFGLPVLEAMACGRAAIASNTSSLPEVVAREDALFDTFDEAAIAQALLKLMTDADYRESLETHGLAQARRFSWDASARQTWEALASRQHTTGQPAPTPHARPKPRLAYVSPLPPEETGIAASSVELLPALSRHYDIEVVVAIDQVTDPWVRENCTVRSVAWFRRHGHGYDRVMYHVGNSSFHEHMFPLIHQIPGVVVLHEVSLALIYAKMEGKGVPPFAWTRSLYAAHGYPALVHRFGYDNAAESAKWAYPCSFEVIESALGVVVHSEAARQLAARWYGDAVASSFHVIAHLRHPVESVDRDAARQSLGLSPDDFLVCSFGFLGPTKLNDRLVKAWCDAGLSGNTRCRLVFVGKNPASEYAQDLADQIQACAGAERISITGWVDADAYQLYLAAADVAVQLRGNSGGEASAAVLDCMGHGIPTIVNANGSMAELPDDAVILLPDEFADEDLSVALHQLLTDESARHVLATRAKAVIQQNHQPAVIAQQFADAIEASHGAGANATRRALSALGRLLPALTDGDGVAAVQALAQNQRPATAQAQLLVDVSELARRDAKTGIQRVTRSILRELLANPPQGFRVEPVYATLGQVGYRYARQFTCDVLRIPKAWAVDEPIDVGPGDVFLGLDLDHASVVENQAYLQHIRSRGVAVHFVVFDLLPVMMSEKFVEGGRLAHHRWLTVVALADGAMCISRAVADQLQAWLHVFGGPRVKPFKIGWFHLGADVENSIPSKGMPADATRVLAALATRPSFLVVGTIEPRKGIGQTLDAFEQLWARGIEAHLVIVGSQGWMVDALVDRLRTHRERGRRLFWLEGISDEYLEKIYAAAACLLSPSEGEGFGLPLIEAAQHRLPVIARDIPVFREVAGDNAYYFGNDTRPETLADAVAAWLGLLARAEHPRSGTMRRLSWATSARQMLRGPLRDNWRSEWMPDGVHRYWGCDPRLFSQIGLARGTSVQTTGREGFLIFGPYQPYSPGRYRLVLRGEAQQLSAEGCWFDLTCDRGARRLNHTPLTRLSEAPTWQLTIDFVLDRPALDLEFRVRVDAAAVLRIDEIAIEPRSEPVTRYPARDHVTSS